MKTCMQCGAEAADDNPTCEECGYRFVYVAGEAVEGYPGVAPPAQARPSGEAPMMVGGCCLAGSILLGLIGLMRDADTPGAVAGNWGLVLLGAALFQLFLVFWGVGYIVRAISFLPASDHPAT
jgi:hypothetical protein